METIQRFDTVAASQYLGVQACTLEAWRSRGTGPKFIKLGRLVRYDQRDLDQWLSSRTVGSTSELLSN